MTDNKVIKPNYLLLIAEEESGSIVVRISLFCNDNEIVALSLQRFLKG